MNNKDKIIKKQKSLLPEGGLLQSKYWTAVLRAEKKDVWQAENIDKEVYCTNYKLPLVGEYGYCPRAYNLTSQNIEKIVKQAQDKNLGWLRLDIQSKELIEKLGEKYSIQTAPHNMQPKQNFIINIDLTEEELLAGMKSKTRYNIRLAKKKGVEILVTREQKYINKFIDLVEQTAKRKGISFHQREHYLQMFKNISKDVLQLYVAEYEGEVIATNIISFYGGVGTYLHGATSDKYRNVMAPFLLQWQAILDAKERGIKHYDFGGIEVIEEERGKGFASRRTRAIAEGRERQNLEERGKYKENEVKDVLAPVKGKLQGITKFKLGFSPKTKPFQTAGSYDVILNKPKYYFYRLLQKIK